MGKIRTSIVKKYNYKTQNKSFASFLILTFTLILHLLIQGCFKLARDGKPNFVIIFTDNQGYGDVGCFVNCYGGYGSTASKTPNLDKMAGGKLPKRRIDGKDIWTLMCGCSTATSPHEAIFFYNVWGLEAVRSGKWKLHVPHEYRYPAEIGMDGSRGYYTFKKIDTSLFNLSKDIGERYDVSKNHPEVVNRLLKLIKEMREDLGDSYIGMSGNNRRPPGRSKD